MISGAAPLIALVGSDGSGKSTVGQALLEWLREAGPAELCHLGKQSGNLGRAAGRLPLVGRRMGKTIDHKVKAAGSARGPGPVTAVAIYAFTLRRLWRFRRMLAIRERGVTILSDRFPQIDVPDALDGPGFARVRHEHGLPAWLAAREKRHFDWMTSHRPDIVLRLNVDPATAAARKPDHSAAALASKIAKVSLLTFGGTIPIVDIDANQPLDLVIAEAKAALAKVIPAA